MKIFYFVFTLSIILSCTVNEIYAQNLSSDEILKIEEKFDDLEKSLNDKISTINEKQEKIIQILSENEIHLGTAAKNINESLESASDSFWYSAALTNIIAVSLAIFGILVTLMLTLGPITKKEGSTKKFAGKWIIIGVILGVLLYFLILNIQTLT